MRRETVRGLRRKLAAAGHPVTESAVRNWVLGYATPRTSIAAALTKISRGSVELNDIVEHGRTVAQAAAAKRAGSAGHGSDARESRG